MKKILIVLLTIISFNSLAQKTKHNHQAKKHTSHVAKHKNPATKHKHSSTKQRVKTSTHSSSNQQAITPNKNREARIKG